MKSLRPAILYFAVLFAALIPAASARRTPSSALLRSVAAHAGIAATAQGPTLLTTLLNGAVATGPGTDIGVRGLSVVGVQLTGITTATITWEATIDGVTWVSVIGTNSRTQAQAVTATGNDIYTVNVAGKARFRPNVTAYTAGAVTATILLQGQGIADGAAAGGGGGGGGVVTQATASNLNALVTQGAAGASAWPVSLAALPALATGANVIGAVTQSGTWTVQPGNTANTTPWLATIAQGGNSATVTAGGNLNTAVNAALPTGANVIGGVTGSGNFTVVQATAANLNATVTGTVTANAGSGTQNVAVQAATSGGATPGKYIAAASANQDSTVIKASAGQLYWLIVGNAVSAIRYVKLYDKATGPTSADTPIQTYLVPHNTAAGAGFALPIPSNGMKFTNGISFRITTGIADSDATAATANDVVLSYGSN